MSINSTTNIAFLLVLVCGGCGNGEPVVTRSMPAPVSEMVQYDLVGEIERVWGGDHFEFGDRNQLHFILVRGVDCPKHGQRYYSPARHATMDWTEHKNVRIKVVDRDELMTEIADVFIFEDGSSDQETNLALKLVQEGFAWYDGNEFEGAEALIAAQALAKENKKGLWSQENPIPPWDYESKETQSTLNKLKLN